MVGSANPIYIIQTLNYSTYQKVMAEVGLTVLLDVHYYDWRSKDVESSEDLSRREGLTRMY